MALTVITKISKLILGLALIFFSFAEAKAQPTIVLQDGEVWVKHLDKEVLYTFARYHNTQQDWESVFPVQLKEAQNGIVIGGTYEVFETSVRFTPRFPFAAGVAYVATFFTDQLANNFNEVYLPKMASETLGLDFQIQKAKTESPVVVQVYPTSDLLPENLLKFHIQFSQSMTVGEIYKRVKLLDSDAKEVEKAFLIVDQEFWDEEMKVVTLLLDPGRIKRGLKANLEMSSPLQKDHQYTLVIERHWKDINGNYLSNEFRKTFLCIRADRTSPNLNSCKLTGPIAQTSELLFHSNEPLNLISLSNGFIVRDSRGEVVAGDFTPLENEMGFSFKPKDNWNNDKYVLHINPLVEDLAGNNFNRVFDKDLQNVINQNSPLSQLTISFTVSTVRQ